MEKLPCIVRSLDGDSALKFRTMRGCRSVVDVRAIYGVVELDKYDLDEGEKDNESKTILVTGWGSIRTTHPLALLEDLLYPITSEE